MGFQQGDLLQAVSEDGRSLTVGKYYLVDRTATAARYPAILDDLSHVRNCGEEATKFAQCLRLISRPDADGWYPWAGDQNPALGRRVEVRGAKGNRHVCAADDLLWNAAAPRNLNPIVAFRFADEPKVEAPEPVEPETPAIDVTRIREGDFITVRRVVTHPVASDGLVVTLGASSAEDILAHEPTLRVKDRVRSMDHGSTGEVLAIDGQHVGVRWDNGAPSFADLSSLTRL